ncbi:MAG: glycosyltransferase family 2 protein [Muribaculaceae bacterium]|nr:glycosyltransferase family 2 protein [Muribaculaceae bacterium]
MKKKKVSLLVPAYNEEKSMPSLHEALIELMDGPLSQDYDFEVLLINDGSSDRTLEIIKEMRAADPRICYVNLSRNFGKENAMLAGFDYVTGDCTVILDADLQDPVEVIPEMLKWWEEGYEDVYGRRRHRGKESWLRKELSLTFYNFLQNSTRFDILPNVGDFRLLDNRCIKALRHLRETQRYTKGLFCWIGFKKKEVLFDRHDREAGKSSFNIKSLFNLAIEGITSFSTSPLRLASILGMVIAFVAFVYMIVIFTKTLIWGDDVQGFPALMCVILFLGGIQLLCIGIIGEYVGRIFNESKNRPVYIIDSYNGEQI